MRRSAYFKAAVLFTPALVVLGAVFPMAAWSGKGPAPVKTVTLRVYHRVFHNFAEDDKVRLNEEFPIGDTDYTATIVEYIPDFAMVMGTHKVVSRTNEPNNPAFRIIVKEKGVVADTTWAMLNMPPHFARKSMLAFQVRRIDFKGHSPIVNKDKPPVMFPPKATEQTGQAPTSRPAAGGPASRPSGGNHP